MIPLNIPEFIKKFVTKRTNNFFEADCLYHQATLTRAIKGKSILVIGGAGTIGTNYIKEALKFFPSEVIVVDTNENGLTALTRLLRSSADVQMPERFITYPFAYNAAVFYKMYKSHGAFDIVANFAAHKHVRSEKDVFSIAAMLQNNVLDLKRFLDHLKQYKPTHFFCVSSDKATNPVNIMGASKKLMEQLIMCYSDDFKVTTARFANVAFSQGSLLDGYLQRWSQGQPISCPSDVARFFVSPEESGSFCLLASILGSSGAIYFPKLEGNQQVFFKNITEDFFLHLKQEIKVCATEKEAKEMAEHRSDKDPYPVYFFNADTSGEKLSELFYTPKDKIDMSTFQSIGMLTASSKSSFSDIETTLTSLKQLFTKDTFDKKEVIKVLNDILPDFNHKETGKNLDQKM